MEKCCIIMNAVLGLKGTAFFMGLPENSCYNDAKKIRGEGFGICKTIYKRSFFHHILFYDCAGCCR